MLGHRPAQLAGLCDDDGEGEHRRVLGHGSARVRWPVWRRR
ncbi:hypothetical protein [Pseudenhygromyxa sp. WMMC2535]|nr:hypothetical protein [Pseudenhygromyxa sp. WMMC2535]